MVARRSLHARREIVAAQHQGAESGGERAFSAQKELRLCCNSLGQTRNRVACILHQDLAHLWREGAVLVQRLNQYGASCGFSAVRALARSLLYPERNSYRLPQGKMK
jgi:hypothetical protein